MVPPQHIGILFEALEWLSLVPSPVGSAVLPSPMPPLPAGPMAPLDIFAYLLSHKLKYESHERDMVVLAHEIVAQPSHGGPEEVFTSSLITYGTPKASAMARTVGLPVAFAALNVVDGKIGLRGVRGPGDVSVYEPVLRGLEEVGLGMVEGRREWKKRLERGLVFAKGGEMFEGEKVGKGLEEVALEGL